MPIKKTKINFKKKNFLKKSFESFVSKLKKNKFTDPKSPVKGIGIVIYKKTKINKLQKKILKKSFETYQSEKPNKRNRNRNRYLQKKDEKKNLKKFRMTCFETYRYNPKSPIIRYLQKKMKKNI